ncbi:MAG: SpoIIIAH-like family protein [Desulfotomaculaceae bacterium]|nr:SpoIIIAH-like family protein [Desulfotomaculaceae bacterium]
MRAVIINRRTLLLVVLIIIALTALFLCWPGSIQIKTIEPGLPVAGEVKIESSEPRASAEDSAISNSPVVRESPDFFVDYRLERERTRGQRVEWLREVFNNENSSDETRQKAQESLLSISNCMAKEVEMENLMKANGYEDSVVLVDDRFVTVILPVDSLSTSETNRLSSLVARGTGVDMSNVVIVPKR